MRGLIALALACCVGLVSAALEPTKQEIEKTAQADQYRSDAQRGSRSNPFVVETVPREASEIQVKADRAEKEEKSLYEFLTAWGTVALAAFTLLLVGVTTGLAVFTLKLWRSTGELVRGAEDTAKHELRAYLGATPHDIIFLSGHDLQTYIEITNTGKTPAKNVRRWRTMELREPAARGNFVVELLAPEKRPIAPGHKWNIGIELAITDQQRMLLLNRKLVLFVWGRVEYEDCFGGLQWLEFRYENIGTVFTQTAEGSREVIGWSLHPMEEGNDAT